MVCSLTEIGNESMNVLPIERQIQAIAALTEGCSIRSVERLTDTHRDTIGRFGVIDLIGYEQI